MISEDSQRLFLSPTSAMNRNTTENKCCIYHRALVGSILSLQHQYFIVLYFTYQTSMQWHQEIAELD